MLGSKAVDTPMDPNQKLTDDLSGEPVEKGRYQRMVGKLIYLSHTRHCLCCECCKAVQAFSKANSS